MNSGILEMIDETLGRYRIVAPIGAGGMGEVYRAHDERLDRDVALKVLPLSLLSRKDARKRFRREALALSKLNPPNIATVYDFDSQGHIDFLVAVSASRRGRTKARGRPGSTSRRPPGADEGMEELPPPTGPSSERKFRPVSSERPRTTARDTFPTAAGDRRDCGCERVAGREKRLTARAMKS